LLHVKQARGKGRSSRLLCSSDSPDSDGGSGDQDRAELRDGAVLAAGEAAVRDRTGAAALRPSGDEWVRRHDSGGRRASVRPDRGRAMRCDLAAEVLGRLVGIVACGPSAWRQLCAFGAWLTAVTISACRWVTWCIATRVGEHRRSVRTIGPDRRSARCSVLASVKLSSDGAGFVVGAGLQEQAAWIIFNGALGQAGLRRVLVARSTNAGGSGEPGRGVGASRACIAADACFPAGGVSDARRAC
jgi:hypothetical protein